MTVNPFGCGVVREARVISHCSDKSDCSAELELLILLSYPNAATLWPDQISGLLPKIDQAQFIRLIGFHRVALAVNRNLLPQWRQQLTEPFLARLAQQTSHHQQQVWRQCFQQSLIQKAFYAAGITHRFFKGLALSQQLYQDLSWRYSKDIDLLIGLADREQATLLLQQLGFVSEYAQLSPGGLGTRLRQALQKDCVFTKPDGTIVELHWRLDNAHCRYGNHMANFYLSQPVGFSVDEFVYLCLHAAKSHCHRLKWLVDVAVYAVKLQQSVPDWQLQAKALARQYGVTFYLNLMLLLIQRCYGGLVPITQATSPAEAKRLDVILGSWQQAALPARATLRSVMKPFLMMPNAGYTLRLLLNLAFWPNPDDIKLLNRLPAPLNYLFLPLFPGYKLGRYLVRVVSLLLNKTDVKRANDPAS